MNKEDNDLISGVFALAIKQLSTDSNPIKMKQAIASVLNLEIRLIGALQKIEETSKEDGKNDK